METRIMDKPHQIGDYDWINVTLEELKKGSYYQGIFYGCHMHTHDIGNVYHDIETWNYPSKSIEKKIRNNKRYKVWARYRDAADPMDSSCSYTIIYIEEI